MAAYFLRQAALVTGLVAVSSNAFAAPVLWSTRPSGLTTGGSISATEDAEALDELTAPLSANQMGLSQGVDFTTTFDEDIKALGDARREQERRDADILPDPLNPRIEGPNLRFQPRLQDSTNTSSD